MIAIMLFLLFLCWGSFLNVVAYRLVRGESFVFPRSHCPHCRATILWYDNIPVVSWLALRGRCRRCKASISWLYPVVELGTAITLTALYLFVPFLYFPAYFLFFSALIVSFRSDAETMLISQWVTLFLLPIAPLCSLFGLLPISLLDSLFGALLGYFFLWGTSKLFAFFTGKEGIGAGDFELLAFIGSFLGVVGCWLSLLVASLTGSIFGIIFLLVTGSDRQVKFPFGPFLVIGAILIAMLRFILPWPMIVLY